MKTKKKNIDSEASIRDYLFSGISFSTFRFNPLAYAVLKYDHSKSFILKRLAKRQMEEEIKKVFTEADTKIIKNYLSHTIDTALKNASFLISNKKKEIALAKKVNQEILIIDAFKKEFLHENNYGQAATFILNKKEDALKYQSLINAFVGSKVIILEEIKDNSLMFDKIRVTMLSDDADLYFIGESTYQNYISNCAFTLNKISVQI